MGLSINSATGAMVITKSLYQTSVMQKNTLQRLSSGIKINSASDDAAGLSISQKLSYDISGNMTAKNNTQTGISLLNTADGALSVMTKALERARILAVQSANGIYSTSERQMLQKEVDQLSTDIKQTYQCAKFNNKNVFQGDLAGEYDAAIASGYDEAHIITGNTDFVSKITGHESENFILISDFDMSATTFNNSIFTNAFSGQLNGNGHIISNIKIDTGSDATSSIGGLFSEIVGGTVKNIGLENISINSANGTSVGGIAAYVDSGTIDGCYTTGTINGNVGGTGGIVGWNYANAHIINTYSTVNVSGDWGVGGLIGANWSGSVVENCYATGNVVNIGGDAGGLIGNNYSTTIKNCYATGSVDGIGYAAGLVGYNKSGTITNSFATGTINSGSIQNGLVGANTSGGTDDNTNFYKNNMSTDGGAAVNANVLAQPTGGWDTNIWDLSGAVPALKHCGPTTSTVTITPSQFQIGSDANASSKIDFLKSLFLGYMTFDISSQTSAQSSISEIDAKILELNQYRSDVGSSINRMQGILNIQDNRIINLSSSNSSIKDANIATESALLIKDQIKQQTSTTLLSQVKNLDKNLLMQLIN